MPTAQDPASSPVVADNGNRAAAMLLDVILLLSLSAFLTTRLASPFSEYTLPTLWLIYFTVMPLTRIQGSIGQGLARLKLCDRQGARLSWRASLIRTLAGLLWLSVPIALNHLAEDWTSAYLLSDAWWTICFLPVFFIGFMPLGESLFDLLAGSVLVKYACTPPLLAEAQAQRQYRITNGLVLSAVGIIAGYGIGSVTEAQHQFDIRHRVSYAMSETIPLRQQIEAFYAQAARWPTASELGIPEWKPYPDGGGYHLLADGRVVIRFAVHPRLKGREIRFTPELDSQKKIHWRCHADSGKHLPLSLRSAGLNQPNWPCQLAPNTESPPANCQSR